MDVETTSSAPSTGPSILQVPTELQKTHNLDSRATNADLGGDLANLEVDTYKGLDWKLFPGFQIPPPSKRDRRSYIWQYCYEIYQTDTQKIYAVCKACNKKTKTKYATGYRWLDSSTGRCAEHLKEKHNIGKDGIIKLLEQGPDTLIGMMNRTPEEQAAINSQRRAFDEARFKKLLTRWIIQDQIAFD
jgi:hypothetical protein